MLCWVQFKTFKRTAVARLALHYISPVTPLQRVNASLHYVDLEHSWTVQFKKKVSTFLSLVVAPVIADPTKQYTSSLAIWPYSFENRLLRGD